MRVNMRAVVDVPVSDVVCPKTGETAKGFIVQVSWGTEALQENNIETTKRYVFTEEALEFLKQNGFIKQEIVDETNVGWFPKNPDDMSEKEKEDYHPDYLEKLSKLHEGSY